MPVRGRLTAICLALCFAAACTASSPVAVVQQTSGACSSPVVGVQFHGLWSDYDDRSRTDVLRTLADSGVRSVRIDISWAALEPRRGRYDPAETALVDRVLDQAVAAGLEPLVMVWLTPSWANGGAGDRALPDDPQSIAGFATWAARRWTEVGAWQVWNEPNSEDFLVGADPAGYTALLRAAYRALHAGAPDTLVVFGGTQYQDVDWIAAAYRAGAGGAFDVMATHGYQAVGDEPPAVPADGTPYRLTAVAAVRDLMVANGDGDLPIWFTEFGWSAHGGEGGADPLDRGVTEAEQADFLVETLELLTRDFPYVERAYWYNERNRATGDPRLDNYGLLTRDGSRKPVALALREARSGCP